MKIRLLLAAAPILLSVVNLSAQTREIAFKSHSGDPAHFTEAMNRSWNDLESDFGLPPKEITSYKLDSVILVSDSVSVMVRKEYARPFDEPKTAPKFVKVVRDTLVNDALLSRKHELDSIRNILSKEPQYINANELNKVVFIGYDNKKAERKPKKNMPVLLTPGDTGGPSPFDGQMVWMIGAILLLSLMGGWVSWRFYNTRVVPQ